MKLAKYMKALWNDDRGQTTTEYILMLSVVVMIALKFKNVIGNKIQTLTDKVGGEMDQVTNNN